MSLPFWNQDCQLARRLELLWGHWLANGRWLHVAADHQIVSICNYKDFFSGNCQMIVKNVYCFVYSSD